MYEEEAIARWLVEVFLDRSKTPPERIVLDVEAGLQRTGKCRDRDYLMVLDRAEAIARGIAEARPGDLVLIAGKGHEDYQIIGNHKRHFDDREVAAAAMQEH